MLLKLLLLRAVSRNAVWYFWVMSKKNRSPCISLTLLSRVQTQRQQRAAIWGSEVEAVSSGWYSHCLTLGWYVREKHLLTCWNLCTLGASLLQHLRSCLADTFPFALKQEVLNKKTGCLPHREANA